jgi:hypothetical protein
LGFRGGKAVTLEDLEKENRNRRIEYRILIALLFLGAVINLLIFLRLGGVL